MAHVRAVEKRDADAWADMRLALWPDAQRAQLLAECNEFLQTGSKWIAAAFIAVEDDESPRGFIEMNIRSVAEGCEHSPVPHVEGWYVAPNARRTGIGRALMTAAEGWAREHGFSEMTSDTTDEYPVSIAAHEANGFEVVERLIALRKSLH